MLIFSDEIIDNDQEEEEEEEEAEEEEDYKDVCNRLSMKRKHFQQFADGLSVETKADLDILYMVQKRIRSLESEERAASKLTQKLITDFAEPQILS